MRKANTTDASLTRPRRSPAPVCQRIDAKRVDPQAVWRPCPEHGKTDSPAFIKRPTRTAGVGVGAHCPACNAFLGWVRPNRSKPAKSEGGLVASFLRYRAALAETKDAPGPTVRSGGDISRLRRTAAPYEGQEEAIKINDASNGSSAVADSVSYSQPVTDPSPVPPPPPLPKLSGDSIALEPGSLQDEQRPRKKKKPKPIPVTTPESLALWNHVASAARGQPAACRSCVAPRIPVLYRNGNHIGGRCPACGSFMGFLPQNAEEHDEATRASNWRRWLSEGEERGYKPGYALASFRSAYHCWPPWDWSQPDWVAGVTEAAK